MVSDWPIMDLSASVDCSILTELIIHLPPGENTLSVFSFPRAEINVLLVNVGNGKETNKGFGIMKGQLESYTTTMPAPLCHGSNGRVYNAANSLPYPHNNGEYSNNCTRYITQ